MRWRIERCGTARSGYLPGWMLHAPGGQLGWHFNTWAECIGQLEHELAVAAVGAA